MNALAYTVALDVVFEAGRYSPGIACGQKLLAHELMHVVQRGSHNAIPGQVKMGPVGDEFERKADEVAASILDGNKPVWL